MKPKHQPQPLDNCAFCGTRFTGNKYPNVDKYHRLTPLCQECYASPEACRATESEHDPSSWWNKTDQAA
jgi:hypothetical protein